jgi:regulator of protease activity HflC (stomatin/prohibitin superfamily)
VTNAIEFEARVLQNVEVPSFSGQDFIAWFGVAIGLLIVAWALGRSARMIRPTERGLVERFGKYHHFVKSGLTFLIPFADRLIKVNITERMSQVQPQEVITKDKVVMQVDAVIFFKVKPDEESVKASEYNVSNFETQIEVVARTTLRNIIGTLEMAEANVSRDKINASLKEQLTLQSQTWGYRRVERRAQRPCSTKGPSGVNDRGSEGEQPEISRDRPSQRC